MDVDGVVVLKTHVKPRYHGSFWKYEGDVQHLSRTESRIKNICNEVPGLSEDSRSAVLRAPLKSRWLGKG